MNWSGHDLHLHSSMLHRCSCCRDTENQSCQKIRFTQQARREHPNKHTMAEFPVNPARAYFWLLACLWLYITNAISRTSQNKTRQLLIAEIKWNGISCCSASRVGSKLMPTPSHLFMLLATEHMTNLTYTNSRNSDHKINTILKIMA